MDDSEAPIGSEGDDNWMEDHTDEYDEDWYNERLIENVGGFIKASKKTGKKTGVVFKLGAEGIGYYRDGPVQISIAEAVRPSSKVI